MKQKKWSAIELEKEEDARTNKSSDQHKTIHEREMYAQHLVDNNNNKRVRSAAPKLCSINYGRAEESPTAINSTETLSREEKKNLQSRLERDFRVAIPELFKSERVGHKEKGRYKIKNI